jgi:hypothetical protein
VGWDGSHGRIPLVKSDTYTWKIEYKETMSDQHHITTGHVNVLR